MSEELLKQQGDVVTPVGGDATGIEPDSAAAAAGVTERGRSPSGVTTAAAAAATPASVAANTSTISQEWPESVTEGLCPEESPEVICTLHHGIIDGALAASSAGLAVDRLDPFVEPALCVAHLRPG